MTVKELISNLENSFHQYETVQIRHLDNFKNDDQPDLGLMTKERADAFKILKSAIENFTNTAGTQYGEKSISDLNKYEDRLSLMMELDDKIAIEIKKYRENLKSNLDRVKKGKVAMTGYRNAGSNSQNPRVLSMNR